MPENENKPVDTQPPVENTQAESANAPVENVEEPTAITKGLSDDKTKDGDDAKTPEEEKKEGEADKPKELTAEEKAALEVPVDGKYELKAPEGVKLSEEDVKKYGEFFKDMKLSRADAQKSFEYGVGLVKEAKAAALKEVFDYRDTTDKENVKAIKNDPELGGAKYEESVSFAQRALRQYGSDALFKKLDETRLGNDPEFFKFCSKVGKTIGESGSVKTSTDNAHPKENASILKMRADLEAIENKKSIK